MAPGDVGIASSNSATPTPIASSRRPREGGDPVSGAQTAPSARATHEPLVRVLYARAGDALHDAEIGFERKGTVLQQRLDAYSGAATSPPEPARASIALSSKVAAALSLSAWLALTAPWLRRRLRQTSGPTAGSAGRAIWWVVHASQTGQAQQLAEQTLARLRTLGADARLLSIAELDATGLRSARRLLLVASTTGEGDAPDTAVAFVRRLMPQTLVLPDLRFALLALGDRSYQEYCAFGRALDVWLQACGAQPLFDRVEVDDGDPLAIAIWLQCVERVTRRGCTVIADEPDSTPSSSRGVGGEDAGQGRASIAPDEVAPRAVTRLDAHTTHRQARAWRRWRLQSRTRLNPHSPAPALCEIELVTVNGAPVSWEPGDVAVLRPQNTRAAVQGWIEAQGFDGDELITVDGRELSLREVLSDRVLDVVPIPELRIPRAQVGAQALAAEPLERIDFDAIARLPQLPSREYSIASTAASGRLRLIVRRQNHADGRPGLGSGTLLDCEVGTELELRVRNNPAFRPPPPEAPLILIGAGSGLAGLLGQLDARIEQGLHANWLLFGERDPKLDRVLADELQSHLDAGRLQHLDLCFSRDPHAPAYVQDAQRAQATRLQDWLARGAHLRVCGSRRGMGEGVHACLIELLGEGAVDVLLAEGRYRREVF